MMEITHTVRVERTDSNAIGIIWYNHPTKALTIHFKTTNTIWEYDGVWPYEFGLLVSAYSTGRHFNEHIRPRFQGRKIYSHGEEQKTKMA